MSPHSGADGLVQGELPPIHLNIDRFHEPCLLPWRTPLLPPKHGWLGQGQVRTVVPVPRDDHLPFLGSPVLPPSRLTGGIAKPTRRYHGRMLIHPSSPPCATLLGKCLHTRRFGTLASPPPPVLHMPWGPHPPGHALVHFAIDRASLFTDQRMSGLPMRAKFQHFRTV